MEELKKLVEDLKNAFENFKKLNDERLKQIEERGSADAATTEAVNKANGAIEDLQKKYSDELARLNQRADDLEDRLSRPHMGGQGGLTDERRAVIANWWTGIKNKGKRRDDDGFEEVQPDDLTKEQIEQAVNYRRDFRAYLRSGRVTNEMSVGSDPDGGYWVDADMSGRMVSFIYETSPIRGLATATPISGDALEGELDLGEADFGWVGETEERPETTTPQVAEWRIPLREMYAQPYTTQRLLDFANRDVGAWLEGKVRRKFSRGEATAFVSGDGAKRPRGYLTYPSGTPGSTVATWQFIQQVASGAAAGLTADGITDLVYALKSEFLPGAVMGMRRDTERQIREMKTGDGAYLWQPDFTERRQARVLGLPLVDLPDMPAVASAALPIVVANFEEAYQIVDSPIGIRVLRDNVTTKGKVKFYTTRYVGGDVVNFEAIKLQVISG